jgi:hypothetical protein
MLLAVTFHLLRDEHPRFRFEPTPDGAPGDFVKQVFHPGTVSFVGIDANRSRFPDLHADQRLLNGRRQFCIPDTQRHRLICGNPHKNCAVIQFSDEGKGDPILIFDYGFHVASMLLFVALLVSSQRAGKQWLLRDASPSRFYGG